MMATATGWMIDVFGGRPRSTVDRRSGMPLGKDAALRSGRERRQRERMADGFAVTAGVAEIGSVMRILLAQGFSVTVRPQL
jgi:hypothetical protein